MWDSLSMSDRSRIIKLAVSSGLTNLDTIKSIYNKRIEEENTLDYSKKILSSGGPTDPPDKLPQTKQEVIKANPNSIVTFTNEDYWNNESSVPFITPTGVLEPHTMGATLPEATIIGHKKTPSMGSSGEMLYDTTLKPVLDALSSIAPSQLVGDAFNLYHGIKGNKPLNQIIYETFNGNSGIVTDRDVQNHPFISNAANFLFDVAVPFKSPGSAKRLLETGLRQGGFNPLVNASTSVLMAPVSPKALRYIWTGKKPKFKGREINVNFRTREGALTEPPKVYTGFFNRDLTTGDPLLNIPFAENDIIDAGLYGKRINHPDLIFRPEYNYGPHAEYIAKNYKGRNIQSYEVPQGKYQLTPEEERQITDITEWIGEKNRNNVSSIKSSSDFYNPVDVGGYIAQYGKLPDGTKVGRMQDIYKFNTKDYSKRYFTLPFSPLMKYLDKNFDPIITYTPWRKL